MSYDAKKAAPRYGIVIRGIINPLVTATMKLINPYKLHIDKESCQPNDSTPKIFVANHGYREDIMNSLLTINQPAYVLMGNVEMFMHSLDGFCMWLNGAILIDRNNKASRKASIEKMKHILLCERSVMIFPEATWNLSDNKLALELFGGFYDLAKITGAEVVPVTTYVAGKNCYSIMNDSTNITEKSMQKENDMLFYIERCMLKMREYKYWITDNNLLIEINKLINLSGITDIELYQQLANSIALKIDELMMEEKNETEKFYFSVLKKYAIRIARAERDYYRVLIRDDFSTNIFNYMEMYGRYRLHGKDSHASVVKERQYIISKCKYYIEEDEKKQNTQTLCFNGYEIYGKSKSQMTKQATNLRKICLALHTIVV